MENEITDNSIANLLAVFALLPSLHNVLVDRGLYGVVET